MRACQWAMIALAATAAGLFTPPAASADPVAPQPNTPCAAGLSGAMTRLSDDKTVLVCVDQSSDGYRWQPVATPYPISDRWFTYGPELKLYGEGRRNAAIRSGDWTGSPQDPNSQCRAEQVAVISAGVVGAPEIAQGAKGQPLSLRVLPQLFSIQLSGYCLWVKVGS